MHRLPCDRVSRGSRDPHPISVLSWCRQQAILCALTCTLHIPMTHIDGTSKCRYGFEDTCTAVPPANATCVVATVTFAGGSPKRRASKEATLTSPDPNATFAAPAWFNSTLDLDQVLLDQMNASQRRYPVPWVKSDLTATWLGNRLRLYMYARQHARRAFPPSPSSTSLPFFGEVYHTTYLYQLNVMLTTAARTFIVMAVRHHTLQVHHSTRRQLYAAPSLARREGAASHRSVQFERQ